MRAKYLSTGKQRQPTEISEVLGRVIESAAVGVDVRQAEMIDQWASFVPGDWGAGRPVGVRDGVLLVVVPDGSTASLLRYQMEVLLTSISRRYGDDLVATIRLQIERA
jgi:predicted nucleic acid-binding Zn ribbon protein